MSGQISIRLALAATFFALMILTMTQVAGAQAGSAPYGIDASQLSISLISPENMTKDDRTAAQSWQPAVAESAQFYGYTLDSSFTYREIACPVAPHHLLLAYESTAPNGSISRFTAVVGRGAQEEIAGRQAPAEIIPILHFGIVPFVPAIANPHSIDVFNSGVSPAPVATEVLSANQAGNQPLLVRALCYLAMVGEEPAALGSPSLDQATIHAPVPTIFFQNRGRIRQQISIRSRPNSYQVWALTFQAGGKLLSATREEHPIDRTPLVLNAANSGSPAQSTGATSITAGAGHVSSQPVAQVPAAPPPATTTAAAAPAAPAEPIASPAAPPAPAAVSTIAETPTPPVPPANPATSPMPTHAAATAAKATNVEPPQPQPPTPPAEVAAPGTEPTTAAVSTLAASTVGAITPAAPAPVAPPSPPADRSPEPPAPAPAAAAVATPPPSPPPAVPAPAAITAAQPPVVVSIRTLPPVKPSLPLPPGRFIPNPPQPPSRFIPDSALKTPPHL